MPKNGGGVLTTMLNITKGEENELIVTVTEKTTISNPYYLFVFKHTTNTVKAFILSDTSDFPNKYNIFTFEEGSDEDHTLFTGQHNYTIHAQTSSSNVDPELADEEVEIGICEVTSAVDSPAEFDVDKPFKQFEG